MKLTDLKTCDHDYQRDGTYSCGCITMVCIHCGDSYERDVS